GIPITLAIVAIETGARAGLELDGVSFPGHFLVRTPNEPPIILDAFDGSLVSVVDCERRLKAALGPAAVLEPSLLGAASAREILVRMLGNLKNGFLGQGDWISAIDCCDRILLVAPELTSELRDRGILWTRLGFVAPAIEDLEFYLEREPEAPEGDQLRQELVRLKAEDVTLH
ncbi:MAG: SirB1 family protein, partial [Myxococcota bacterium]